ncbi:hypothetical protein V1525DRAFT_24852 [Lipomyces kononenkoae]|uniref:Uncharacterized protein n=1 Tax=Lipomyces kononenkoae TaxID=34357 RepID=A0ACC3STF9_LIPKO
MGTLELTFEVYGKAPIDVQNHKLLLTHYPLSSRFWQMTSTIYILYNANGSIFGKLSYACRKLAAESSPCPACDLTHGGLRLTETKEWRETKKQIGAEVRQLHIDELDQEVSFSFRIAICLPRDFRLLTNVF